ncbi:hybrid sensor histidine kinase/response regulator transcription factor [Spirosoma sp.]|uniref:hybrid sensor histidine kinase/response regulator transcription factor n=1 Tax=Spirosoma sp. TaxID=1899569 RepID=UPI003B3ABB25
MIHLHGVPVRAQGLPLLKPEIINDHQGLPQAFVPAILQDRAGFIWMATRDGLCRYDGNHFKVFQPSTDTKPGISSSSLFGLGLDQKGHIWILSDHNDIDILNPLRETFTNISHQPFFKRVLDNKSDIIDALYIDRKGLLWISYLSDKILCVDSENQHVNQYKRPSIPGYFPTFSAFVEDKQGHMWMSNKTGLYRLDQRLNRFVLYPLPANDIRGIKLRQNGDLLVVSSRYIFLVKPEAGLIRSVSIPAVTNSKAKTDWHHTSIVVDSQGNEYFDQHEAILRFNEETGVTLLARCIEKAKFRSLFIDRSDVLWAGTDKSGVLKYNLRANLFRAIPYQRDFYHDLLIQTLGITKIPIPNGAVPYNFRYTFDKAGKMWFNMGTNLVYQIDLHTKQVVPIPFPEPPLLRYAWTDPVDPMATDPDGQIWVVTDSMAMYYESSKWHPFHFPIRAKAQGQRNRSSQSYGVKGYILQLTVDERALWIATRTDGLYRVDRSNGDIKNYTHELNDDTSLSSNELLCLFDDPADKNILWIGTFGSGLCRLDKRTGMCRRFTTQNGLPNNVVYAAIPDQQGLLWIATNQGICRMDRQTFKTRIYTHEDGLLADEFNRFHYLHLPDNQILLGGLEGITSFYPHQLHEDTYQPAVQITDIQINNRSIQADDLTDSLPAQAMDHLELNYDQNFITIAFAAMQYNRQSKIKYRYLLTGVNRDWVEISHPTAEYTDLRWGNYKLLLNASNTSGIWSKHVRELTLIIKPPWWATWWAVLLYVFVGLGVCYVLIRSYLSEQESKQLKSIDAIKKRFYTNITHEFRTPLTLILAPVEQLMLRTHDIAVQQQLEIINQNANQLLGLVNQLLELSKAEAHVLTLRESQGDLVEFLNRVVQSFEPKATAKGIQVLFRTECKEAYYWFDTEKLERIVYNLLANALKFTPSGGRVTMNLMIDSRHELISTNAGLGITSSIRLEISDNGIGIAANKLSHIFNLFYQIDNTSIDQQDGAGIGLALVKELVEIQQGTIQVVSKVSIGTTFIIDLPYRHAIAVSAQAQPGLVHTIETEPVQDTDVQEPHSDESPILLVVEDNVALSNFIVDNLPDHYNVYRASDGGEGLEKALQIGPDLIISDVMMPVMDGYTLCNRLKKDPRTSHIPVILLTAKVSIENRLQGLSSGADDYIAKPFHVQELQLRIRNLLEQRKQLRDWVLTNITNPDSSSVSGPVTEPLIEKLCQIVEHHLDDATFGVEELILESGMSRMNLHRKLKALVSLSTGEFIRNYRLKRAAQMLRQGHSVAETAYRVGFEDPSYFARSFRKLYQLTPSAFAKGH